MTSADEEEWAGRSVSQALSGTSNTTRTDGSKSHRDGGVEQADQSCLGEPKGDVDA